MKRLHLNSTFFHLIFFGFTVGLIFNIVPAYALIDQKISAVESFDPRNPQIIYSITLTNLGPDPLSLSHVLVDFGIAPPQKTSFSGVKSGPPGLLCTFINSGFVQCEIAPPFDQGFLQPGESLSLDLMGEILEPMLNPGVQVAVVSTENSPATPADPVQFNNTYEVQSDLGSLLFCGKSVASFDVIFSGTDASDYLVGTELNELIWGGIGDDVVIAGKGDDCIYGGFGNDFISGRLGADEVHGGAGDDFIKGNKGNDLLFGELGQDRISGGQQDDQISGGKDEDMILGGMGIDTINGNDGNDFVNGNEGEDFIRGDDGDDILLGGNDNDNIAGDGGTDKCSAAGGTDIIDCETVL